MRDRYVRRHADKQTVRTGPPPIVFGMGLRSSRAVLALAVAAGSTGLRLEALTTGGTPCFSAVLPVCRSIPADRVRNHN